MDRSAEGPRLERVLLVDDEPDIRTIARMALELGGYLVETCASGAEALGRAPRFAPDLILLDVMMPEMDGPTTLARLRGLAGLEHTPVVFLTAKGGPASYVGYLEIGAADVIPKPFDPLTLTRRVEEVWARRVQ